MKLKWYSIASLSFPASWAAIAIAALLSFIYLTIRKEKEAADLVSNAFFIFVLAWKLSVILFHFQMTLKNPLTILYFNGGIKGYWIAIVASLLYLANKINRSHKVRNELFLDIWIFTVLIYELAFFILNGEQLLIASGQIVVMILFYTLIRWKSDQLKWHLQLLILFTAFQGFIYSLKGQLLSVPMLTYVVASLIIGYFIQRRLNE